MTDSLHFEIRWEVFNAFNTVNFADPITDIFSPSFQVTRTIGNARLMQFAARLISKRSLYLNS